MALFRALLLLAVLAAAAAPRARGAEAAAECADTLPATKSGDASAFSCEEQKGFKKCEAEWMLAGGYCALTCGRCEPPPADAGLAPTEAPPAAPAAPAAAPAPEAPAAEAPLPAVEQARLEARQELAASAALLGEGGNEGLAVQPVALPGVGAGGAAAPGPPARTPAPAPARAPVAPPEPLAPAAAPAPAAPAAEPAAEPACAGPTALQALAGDKELSTLLRVVGLAGLAPVFNDSTIPFTLFAPVDAAWPAAARALGLTGGLPELLASRNLLVDVLFAHVVRGEPLDAAALAARATGIATQGGGAVFVRRAAAPPGAPPPPPGAPPPALELVSVGSTAEVVAPDAVAGGCTPFALHKIDNALLPRAGATGINPGYQSALARGAQAAAAPAP
jgi:hypothetical protein